MPKLIVFSERAFASLLVETKEKINTETGGVFLGCRKGDIWYVVETVDPGPNSIFERAYFEYDTDYVNHLINKVSRIYLTELDLIGLWHRHPGSFDRFSGTDDITNTKYAQLNESGAISALVNIDPNFRLTVYSVSLPLEYKKINYVVGDNYIPKNIITLKDIHLLMNSLCDKRDISKSSIFDIFKNSCNGDNASTKNERVNSQEVLPEEKFYSFYDILNSFLIKNNNLYLKENVVVSDEEDFGLTYILENLEDDLKFISELELDSQISMNENGQLLLKIRQNIKDNTFEFELLFGNSDDVIIFEFNNSIYEYKEGLIKDTYLLYLEKEGALHWN